MPEWRKIKYLVTICVPMFLAIFVEKYYLNYPRLSVEKYFGISALAIFGSLLYFKSLGGQFISSLAQAAIPRMATFVKDNNYKALNKLLFKMIFMGGGIGTILTIIFCFFGESILRILYTVEYSKYNDVLILILLGTTITFSYIFIGTALTCIRKQWIKLPISIFSFILLFCLINFTKMENMLNVALIVLYIELFSLVVYFIVYYYFISNMKKKNHD